MNPGIGSFFNNFIYRLVNIKTNVKRNIAKSVKLCPKNDVEVTENVVWRKVETAETKWLWNVKRQVATN